MTKLTDIPYNTIKENTRAYEILLLRDRNGSTYADIGKQYNLSAIRVAQIYHKLKFKQIRLYIRHIAFTLGHENTAEIRDEYTAAYEGYQDWRCACAYLEKTYGDRLTAYRGGEPGMPEAFIKALPPLKCKFGEKTTSRIIQMREEEKLTFIAIAEKLWITPAKAKQLYNGYYHEQVMAVIQALQERAQTKEEKDAIHSGYFHSKLSAKQYYEWLTREE